MSKAEKEDGNMQVTLFNDAGEALGVDHVYDPDPNDWADEYDGYDDQPRSNAFARDRFPSADDTNPDLERANGWEEGSCDAMEGNPRPDLQYNTKAYREGYDEGYEGT